MPGFNFWCCNFLRSLGGQQSLYRLIVVCQKLFNWCDCGKNTLAIYSASYHLLKKQELTTVEREASFTSMITLALHSKQLEQGEVIKMGKDIIMDANIYNTKEYKRSRKAYIIQCTSEYFITLLVADAFLANSPCANHSFDELVK